MNGRRTENEEPSFEPFKLAFAGGNCPKRRRQSGAGRVAEAAHLAATAEYFADAFATPWNMGAGVLFSRIGREVILTAAARIDEFELNVVSDPFEMAIAPELPVVSRR